MRQSPVSWVRVAVPWGRWAQRHHTGPGALCCGRTVGWGWSAGQFPRPGFFWAAYSFSPLTSADHRLPQAFWKTGYLQEAHVGSGELGAEQPGPWAAWLPAAARSPEASQASQARSRQSRERWLPMAAWPPPRPRAPAFYGQVRGGGCAQTGAGLGCRRQLLLSVLLFPKHYQLRLLATHFHPQIRVSNRLLRCSKRHISQFWGCLPRCFLHRFINIAII